MIDLYRWFLNPFRDEGISASELTDYATQQLAQMSANNPGGQLSQFMAATDTLLTALGSKVSDEQVKLGVQKARVQAKEDFRATVGNELSKIYGTALAKYGKKGAAMLELFPLGMKGFNNADDGELGNRLEALATAVGSRVAELGPEAKTLADSLAAAWTSAYGQATTGKAGKGSAAAGRRLALAGLREQLFRNLLGLAALFPGEKETATLYCPQHLLDPVAAGGAPKAPAGAKATP